MSGNRFKGHLYIGSYGNAAEPTIHVCSYDDESNAINVIQQVTEAENASFLTVDLVNNRLYAVSETEETDGQIGGGALSYTIDEASGELTPLNRQLTHGAHPCYISLIEETKAVLIANYTGGNAALLPISTDGSLEQASSLVKEADAPLGPNRDRQDAPHAHAIVPHGGFAYLTDLGTDSVHRYAVSEGKLVLRGTDKVHAGAGPRHIVFHSGLPRAYVVNELDSTVTVFEVDRESGGLNLLQTLSALPEGYEGASFAADIHLAASGRFLYTSNRGHDSIAVFAVDPEDGTLASLQHVSCGGQFPRNFTLTPDGSGLLVANQHSGSVIGYTVDQETGLIGEEGKLLLEVSAPVCLQFGHKATV
ncbi:lactonase family protein [Paenibacillus sp. NPDC058071]|uniref:lactonase family protein n=1 Tax=Paenibacillus sp. NPDC058071 TaxID=3346326 RepID=UPI0036D7AA71